MMRAVLVSSLLVMMTGAAAVQADGMGTYNARCAVCHGQGVAGAPKLGDAEQWAPRIAKGKDALHQSALKGLNAMPPKGAAMDLPDEEITAAVDYMVEQAGGYKE